MVEGEKSPVFSAFSRPRLVFLVFSEYYSVFCPCLVRKCAPFNDKKYGFNDKKYGFNDKKYGTIDCLTKS